MKRFSVALLLLLTCMLTAFPSLAQGSAGAASGMQTLKNYAPFLAVLIPLAAYLTAMYKDWRSAQGTLNKAFQGDNDAVVYMTHQVQHNEWKRRMKRHPGFRREVITALCLAWSVQPADYIRALLFDALLCVRQQGYGAETLQVLDRLLRQYEQYCTRFCATGFTPVIDDMTTLRHALAEPLPAAQRKR
ncbi:hypothetical protein F0P96_01190 [Hymenobacter busanensis]|uniref:Uncharacterized protein n=1 Tax=Hymenobacter busanensis TaxID=2607656 RepID=A0A7L4ZU41_9BACT|nr:hypothetical protein [Hymenobacter busanensis]KAA9339269.1 hypothetical protein F0P96_01190 [Hymenobacter busanensis]QHJ06969.1 hypothetical protein GUY19_06560 [Hymenobacter busanensis]